MPTPKKPAHRATRIVKAKVCSVSWVCRVYRVKPKKLNKPSKPQCYAMPSAPCC